MNFDPAKQTWKQGIENEIEFWDSWIQSQGREWPQDYINRFNANNKIDKLVASCLLESTESPNILDVGAGPLTILGQTLPNKTVVNITAVDPLAEQYVALWDKAKVIPPHRTTQCDAEKLDEKFDQNSFDLVHIRNALDHSYDPLLGIQKMIYVVKPNHNVILIHNTNEAEAENYIGFHQWNFTGAPNGQFIIWNRSISINVNEALKNIGTIELLTADQQSIIVKITKH